MDVKVFATTKINYVAKKEEFDRLGGLAAGVCYLPDTIEKLLEEDEEKTKKRIMMTLNSGHHSPYDHPQISLELTNIPKILAMVLNDETCIRQVKSLLDIKKWHCQKKNKKCMINGWKFSKVK